MALRVVFLGKLADLAGAPGLDLPAGTVTIDWVGLLAALDPALAAEADDKRVRVALNGELLSDKTILLAKDGDEVALLPPVSGG